MGKHRIRHAQWTVQYWKSCRKLHNLRSTCAVFVERLRLMPVPNWNKTENKISWRSINRKTINWTYNSRLCSKRNPSWHYGAADSATNGTNIITPRNKHSQSKHSKRCSSCNGWQWCGYLEYRFNDVTYEYVGFRWEIIPILSRKMTHFQNPAQLFNNEHENQCQSS